MTTQTMLDRIPYEIFRKIIKFSYAHPSLTSSFQFDEISLPPIKATHVCRAWRTALLSDPTMWTCIMLADGSQMSPDQLDETLSRSSSAPLDVLIEQTPDSHTTLELYNMLSTVSRQMNRCRQFQITIPKDFVPSVSHCFNKPVPMLQNFYLEVTGNEGSPERSGVLRGIHAILFSGDAPNLKNVHLQVASGLEDLQLCLFKNLSSLHLYFDLSRLIMNTDINGDILLDILQSSPCLRILDISWHFIRQKLALSMSSNRRIPLPYLQQLTLQGRPGCGLDVVNLLLGHLDFRMENASFDITCQDSRFKISDTMPLSRLLSRRRPTFLSIYFGITEVIAEFPARMDEGFAGSTFIAFYPPTRESEPLDPSNFLQTFNLSDVTLLQLGDCWTPNPVILRSIFVALTNLQHLCVRHVDGNNNPALLTSYLKALMPPPPHSNSQTQANSELETDYITSFQPNIETGQRHLFPCPSLRTLELMLISPRFPPPNFDEAYLQALDQCTTIREKAGYPFDHLFTCHSEGPDPIEDHT